VRVIANLIGSSIYGPGTVVWEEYGEEGEMDWGASMQAILARQFVKCTRAGRARATTSLQIHRPVHGRTQILDLGERLIPGN
jgi:hypothetical protein